MAIRKCANRETARQSCAKSAVWMKEVQMKHKIIDGNYIVYSDGKIFNIRYGKYLQNTINGAGYRDARIIIDGLAYHGVHRIVAKCFIPNPQNKPVVDHKNGDKLDNDYQNLQWLTIGENVRKSYKQTGISENRNFIHCELFKGDISLGRFDGIIRASKFASIEHGASKTMLAKHKKYKEFRIVERCNDYPKGE